ncbi:MAG: hypothetical protein V3T22_10605 [Planctomycetota bacterium]
MSEELLTLMPDIDPDLIDAWIAKLQRAGRDPEIYVEAFGKKAKTLKDGCTGFFIAMHRGNKEDEWMSSHLKRTRATVAKKSTSTWPYPQGKNGCPQCYGQGWYAMHENTMDERHEAACDMHQQNGFEACVWTHDIGNPHIIFICRDCNPTGAPKEEFASRVYKTYPVFGSPFEF